MLMPFIVIAVLHGYYDEESAKIDINWQLITENLKGESNLDLIQGWISHH